MKSKLYIIGTAGVPARYGGFETFAENIAPLLGARYDVYIACSSKIYNPSERAASYQGASRFFLPFSPNGIASLLYDFKALWMSSNKSKTGDILLILGIGPGIFLPFFKLIFKGKIILHLDGNEWKRSKWNYAARLFLRLCRRFALRFSDRLIIDNSGLEDSLPGYSRKKAYLLSYGADHLPAASHEVPPDAENHYALIIARAEPENQLELICDTISKLQDIRLIAITNAGNTRHGRHLLKKFKDSTNIIFKDAIYDNPELLQAYRMNTSLYLHGHSAGGTNPSLIEALYSRIPILAYDNIYNRHTAGADAQYFSSADELRIKVLELYDKPQIKHDLSEHKGGSTYSWKTVAELLIKLIKD